MRQGLASYDAKVSLHTKGVGRPAQTEATPEPNSVCHVTQSDALSLGLAFDDAAALLRVLQRLVDSGNTVILIEHHLDLIKCADHIIDLGPGGGDRGGYVVAEGTPEEVAQVEASHTGRFLRDLLGRRATGTLP